jgi:glycosyltransferase involved in cell wall biosynthesis
MFSLGHMGYKFLQHPLYQSADIAHFHWISGAFVSITDLGKVSKPAVWTLRDMWPMTGGCHMPVAPECFGYKALCGNCPHLRSNKVNDLSRKSLVAKKNNIPKHMKIVGISNWISDEARHSNIFQSSDIRTIHNGISLDNFSAVEKEKARSFFGIETKKKIILIGAYSINDSYKGFSQFLASLSYLKKDEFHLCFFGNLNVNEIDINGFEFTSFGFLSDAKSLRYAYSVADVFVAPSIMEPFGKTIVEAMACGTAVVAFDLGGPRDIVSHKETGYLAVPKDPFDLARGILWLSNLDVSEYTTIVQCGIDRVNSNFTASIAAEKYIDLYDEMLCNGASK